ncbi:MAG: HD domain-containing protein [Halobacteriovoraceae bacterium]|jgi:response regulator RpfG family c-di-GMP phosphodiesterase|nr:HD domain-containing protein [Halobacteriovoraceae bacterium]
MDIKKILICDPDNGWESQILKSLGEQAFELLTARSGKEAQDIIYSQEIDIIIIALELRDFTAIEVIKYIKYTQQKTRIILTCKNLETFDNTFSSDKKIAKMGISDYLIKPFKAEKLINLTLDKNASDSWRNLHGKVSANIEEEVSDLDDNFTSIEIEKFYCGNISIFDLYLRISRNKFLKILNAGDFLEKERLLHYQESKGIEKLFFKTKDRRSYINYMNDFLLKISSRDDIAPNAKVAHIESTGKKLVEEIHTNGIDKKIVEEGLALCNNIYTTIQQDEELSGILKTYCDFDDTAESHIFLTTFYSIVITKNTSWATQRSLEIISLGAFLHDIGKIKLSATLRNKKTFEMDSEQLKEYQKHCFYGVDILKNNPLITEPISQVIYQHHELISGTGFPNKLTGSRIYPLAKIVCFADFMAHYCALHRLPLQSAITEVISQKKDIFNFEPECVKSLIKGLTGNDC